MADWRDRAYGKGTAERNGKRFEADVEKVLGYLKRRATSMKGVRREYESLWREIRQYLEPAIGLGLLEESDRDKTAARRDDRKILNSEPRQMLKRYAAGMQSGITNAAQAWFQFVPTENAVEVSERPDLKEFFADVTERCADVFKGSNFYLVTEQIYEHSAAFGTSVALMLRGDEPGEVYLHLLDEGDYWIAEDRHQRVNECLRRMDMTLAQAEAEFMHANLPESWQRKLDEGKSEERVTIWNLVCPKGDGEIFADVGGEQRYASFYWMESGERDDPTQELVDVRGFSYNPVIAYRHRYCGSVYGKGIGEEVLPDLKQLQKIEEYDLRLIAGEAMPAVQAPSSMKGKVNNFPGGVSYYDEAGGTGSQKVTRLFETHNAIEAVEAKVEKVLQRIGRAFYNDLFSAMLNISQASAKQLTAREVSEISAEKVTLLGPVLTRMDHDFLEPATLTCFEIQLKDGFIGDIPDDLLYGEMDVGCEYTSTIHSEMKANLKKRGLFNVLDVTGMVAQFKPDVTAKIDADQIVDEIGSLHPESGRYIRSTVEAEKIRAAAAEREAQAMQSAQMLEMAKTAAQGAKDLSQAKVGGGNALDAIMGGVA